MYIQRTLLQVCVHCCECALGWVKCRGQIPSMGHHTWPHTTSLSPFPLFFYSVLVTKYVFIVHCVYWVCVCVLCTLSSVQSVNMYCLYVNCFVFFALSGARSQEFHSPRHLCCGDVTIKVIWFWFMAAASSVIPLGLLHMGPLQYWLKAHFPSHAWAP